MSVTAQICLVIWFYINKYLLEVLVSYVADVRNPQNRFFIETAIQTKTQ